MASATGLDPQGSTLSLLSSSTPASCMTMAPERQVPARPFIASGKQTITVCNKTFAFLHNQIAPQLFRIISLSDLEFHNTETSDQLGAKLDVLMQKKRRDKAVAKRFFRSVLCSNPVPRTIVTDQLRSYPAAKADIPERAHVKQVFAKAAARVNNRTEKSRQLPRRRERQIQGFRNLQRTQALLSCFGPIRQHFALPKHRINASRHRTELKARFTAWQSWSEAEASINVI